MKKRLLFIFLVFFVAVFAYGLYFFYKKDRDASYPRNWQGMFPARMNFRDLGQSLNQCLKRPVFAEGLVFRANKNFTGWSCNQIQNPQTIYSLNYDPSYPQHYFCTQDNGQKLVGIHFNETFVISDVAADLKNWERPEFKDVMCTYVKNTLLDLSKQQKFLYHCNAGRDRTGALSAILAMIAAEEAHLGRAEIIDAIECDYLKTSDMDDAKRGIIRSFLTSVQAQGGMVSFVQTTCGLSPQLMRDASRNFVNGV